MVDVKVDMTGWKMWEHGVPDSKLTVLRQVDDYVNPNTGARAARWECECSCEEHNHVIAVGSQIKNGSIKSCGCIPRGKKLSAPNEYEKRYDDIGEYYIGIMSNTGNEFYFDAIDYENIKQYHWSESASSDNYHYVVAWDRTLKKYIKLHWLIVGKYYDHIDRNPFNNRRSNLRPATHRENLRNQSKSNRNTSGVVGVGWYSKYNKWRAYITTDKRKTIGYFFNKEDAIRARLEAEAKYYGDFAPQKHLYEQYGIIDKPVVMEEIDEVVKT